MFSLFIRRVFTYVYKRYIFATLDVLIHKVPVRVLRASVVHICTHIFLFFAAILKIQLKQNIFIFLLIFLYFLPLKNDLSNILSKIVEGRMYTEIDTLEERNPPRQ